MSKYLKSIILISLITMPSFNAMAETRYVKDLLRWSLRAEPLKSSQSLRLVSSGMKVQVLVEIDGYTKIRLESGEEGWVSSSHLVKEKTNNILLEEARSRLATVENELAELKQQSPVIELEKLISKTKAENVELTNLLAVEKEQVKSLRKKISPMGTDFSPTQQKILAISIACFSIFIIGFLLGKSLVEKKVKNKFNGMKVW